jgi:proteasome lid subunit RPN8/RPN11
METSGNSSMARWTTPECPFVVEYDPRVLDDIRLAVVDAFFSLPRGGTEIGGLLLGRSVNGRIVINDAKPIECEHAAGPGFTLSEEDQTRLGAAIEAAKQNPYSRPVGWYHSHTRSEIFLSEADLALHNRFFAEPWQVALVVKPHASLPTRAGFFFRDRAGHIRATASFNEFEMEALPIGRLPEAPTGAAAAPPSGKVIDIARATRMETEAEAATPVPTPTVPEVEPAVAPLFASAEPEASRRWLAPVAVVLGLGIGVAGFATRNLWMPQRPAVVPSGALGQAAVGLTATDANGQLQIRWDGKAPDVQRSTGGVLLISDGSQPTTIPLDNAQLASGSAVYQAHGSKVDVILSLSQPNGEKLVQATEFSPAAPAAALPPAEAGRGERDLRAENAALKADNARLSDSNKRMERYIETDRAEHQRQRMQNQAK